jgi:hypothetical protein
MLHLMIAWTFSSLIAGPLIGHMIHFGMEDSGLTPPVG